MTIRAVEFARPSRETLEGAGVHLRRAFGNGEEKLFDPFLMMDDFRGDRPSMYQAGFPWHPHRGIETITYMIEGETDHADSMGNEGTIRAGDVQWMTAGSGIIHQEMPRGNELGRMGGFQLWLNLPAMNKMTDPRYQGIEAAGIPEVKAEGATIRVIAGRVGDVAGPVTDIFVDPEYLDVTLAPNAAWQHPTAPGHTVFAHIFEGAARFGEAGELMKADPGRVVLFGDGDAVAATAGPDGARFLLAAGRPLREPIAWRGPIVMNYPSELDEAWRELSDGTFEKHGAAGANARP
jgi:redox-sensitive bicupin YhaK (pirin superfamily)